LGNKFVDISRRDLLKVVSSSGLVAVGLAGGEALFSGVSAQNKPASTQTKSGEMIYRTLGRTREKVSVNTVKPIECLHYAMNLPTSTVITGIESMEILNQAFEAVRTFQPMSQEQVRELLNRTREVALKGQYEPFKTTSQFDSTAKNPEWLG
jgi:hypothetical protein